MNIATEPSEELLAIPPEGRFWVVLHSRPRCEKKAVDFCERNGIESYLPLQRKAHRYGGRVRTFSSPLFPGYVFCVTDMEQKRLLRQNRNVANLLEVWDQQQLVSQLLQIRRALSVGDVVEVMPYLESGKIVRVKAGPFKGLEGIVVRIKSKAKVVINVDMIRQAVAVEVDSSFLAPA
jgi:transcription antitermination factor NusG